MKAWLNSHSIFKRLLLAASVLLVLFLGVTAWVLDQALQQRLITSIQNELKAHLYSVMAGIDEDENAQLIVYPGQIDPRFSQINSGLYAQLTGEHRIWTSASLISNQSDFSIPGEIGSWRYQDFDDLIVLNFSFSWEMANADEKHFTLAVAINRLPLEQSVAEFRQVLFIGLGGLTFVLLLVQWRLFVWGLNPLKQLSDELVGIQKGKNDQLVGDYPIELSHLTNNMNELIKHDQQRQRRFKNQLGDLAHSLKTPLAVLQSSLDGHDDKQLRKNVHDQLPYMQQMIRYQLDKTSNETARNILKSIKAASVIQRIISSLEKVYQDKQIQLSINLDEECMFFGDEGDFMEMAGNLLDNAFKYGTNQIAVQLGNTENGCILSIEDDGAGILQEEREQILQRGMRLDETQLGQGIGLSVVNELVQAYQGEMVLSQSRTLKGLQVQIIFVNNC